MLVVRSQDMKKLIANNLVYKVHKNSVLCFYEIRVSYVDKLEEEDYIWVASYFTEEKALKVLDMLEKFFTADKNGTFNFPKDYEVK